MIENITVLEIESIEVEETPALPINETYFWKDNDGEWQTVKLIDCEPKGWGFATIQWYTPSGWHTKPVPSITLCNLDEYLDQQPDYGRFEADDTDYDSNKDERAERECGQYD